MGNLITAFIITLVLIAGLRSCTDDGYDLERDGLKPIVMEVWCGTSCVEGKEENL